MPSPTMLKVRQFTERTIQFWPANQHPSGEPRITLHNDGVLEETYTLDAFGESRWNLVGKTRTALAKQLNAAGLDVPAWLAPVPSGVKQHTPPAEEGDGDDPEL